MYRPPLHTCPPKQAIMPAYYMPALMEHAIGVDTTDVDEVGGTPYYPGAQ